MRSEFTIEDEIYALILYIDVKNPGPTIRQAIEVRINQLRLKGEPAVFINKNYKPVACMNIKTKTIYKSIREAARDLNMGYDMLRYDIYENHFRHGIILLNNEMGTETNQNTSSELGECIQERTISPATNKAA